MRPTETRSQKLLPNQPEVSKSGTSSLQWAWYRCTRAALLGTRHRPRASIERLRRYARCTNTVPFQRTRTSSCEYRCKKLEKPHRLGERTTRLVDPLCPRSGGSTL